MISKEAKKIYDAKYREKNKISISNRIQDWRDNNKELMKKTMSNYYINHKDDILENTKANSYKYRDKKRIRQASEKNKQSNRDLRLVREYGITRDKYNDMLAAQECKCAICAKPFKTTLETHVDHDHKTNNVRDLLCARCNLGIGYLLEDPVILRNAAKYLEKWNKQGDDTHE